MLASVIECMPLGGLKHVHVRAPVHQPFWENLSRICDNIISITLERDAQAPNLLDFLQAVLPSDSLGSGGSDYVPFPNLEEVTLNCLMFLREDLLQLRSHSCCWLAWVLRHL